MFVDRYSTWQSDEEFLKIEGVAVVSETPTPPISGVGSGCVAVVGEFLKGLVNTPTEVFSPQEIKDLFGTWADWNNPGGPINSTSGKPEPGLNPTSYDGNGFLAIRGRKFKRLVLVNVNQACEDGAGAMLTAGITITAAAGVTPDQPMVIPAGIRVAITGATPADVFATCEAVTVAVADWTGTPKAATKNIKIRRVKGTGSSSVALTQVLTPEATAAVPGYTLSCTATLATVTDPDLSARYVTALASLLANESPAADVNIVCVARHPGTTKGETLMKALRTHATDASAIGHGRRVVMAPPVGTTQDVAKGSTASTVGVGNVGGDERADYAYPAVKFYAPELAAASCSSAQFPDGIVTWPFDTGVAACEAEVNPEVNPGVQTDALDWVLGVEQVAATTGGTAAPLLKEHYVALRTAGIAAPKKEGAKYVIQSGVTSKGSAYTIKRRRMADYIEDSLADAMAPFQKQPATRAKRDAILSLVDGFLGGLKSVDQPTLARIEDYSISERSNTDTRLGKGIYVLDAEVRTLASLDKIVFRTLIGEMVEITPAE